MVPRGRRAARGETLSRAQQLLVDEVWALLCEAGRWPRFAELDRRLYRNCDLQADEVLRSLPPGIVAGDGALPDDAEVALTVHGVARCGRGRRELGLFLEALALAVAAERDFEPSADGSGRPSITAAQVARAGGHDHALLLRLGLIMRVEGCGWSPVPGADPRWTFEVDRSVRRFQGVESLDDYRAARAGRSRRVASRGRVAAAVLLVAGVLVLVASAGLDPAEKWVSIAAALVSTLGPALLLALDTSRGRARR